MNTAKVMPYSEKYTNVAKVIAMFEDFVPPFIQKHLGDQAVTELREIWQEGVRPIRVDASAEEKYEIVYSNFIWMAKSNFAFLKKHMGADGLAQFERQEVKELIKQNASPALALLGFMRKVSPSRAFLETAKSFSYQLQWITPFSVTSLDEKQALYDIPSCKILDYPDVDDICYIGCMSIYPAWVAEQFKVKMEFDRQEDKRCVCTISPLW